MRPVLCTCFAVTLILVFPVMFFTSRYILSDNDARPVVDDDAYLNKALTLDEKMLDQFNYFLARQKDLNYVINLQVSSQQVLARTTDPDYRIKLAINLLDTSGLEEAEIWRAFCRALEAIGSKWTLRLEYFVARHVADSSKNRSQQVAVLESVLTEGELNYGRIARKLENTTISTQKLEAYWTAYKTSHLPGIEPHCLRPFPNAMEMLKLFDTSLFYEGACTARYRTTYWTIDEFETMTAWSYLFVVCIVFGRRCRLIPLVLHSFQQLRTPTMADKSAFVPLDAAGTNNCKARPAELDIDVDDNDYFGGTSKQTTPAPAAQSAPQATPATTPAAASSNTAKKTITYQKAKGYQKTYAYSKK